MEPVYWAEALWVSELDDLGGYDFSIDMENWSYWSQHLGW